MEDKLPKARVLAFYLPQFHPIPENDRWWGEGFTEWTNVRKAKPLYPGHCQPRIPADLGYYDLRDPAAREAQAAMAKEYGIEGFIYWHYWFGNGKRLLERPFDEVLASGQPDYPFALAWANESWRGFWFGLNGEREVLMEQTYPGEADYINHFNTVLPAFKDKRYITVDNKPLFFVYKPNECPDIEHFIDLWQKLARENGLEGIYFVAIGLSIYDKAEADKYYSQMMEKHFDGVSIINSYCAHLSFVRRWFRRLTYSWVNIFPDLRPYTYEQFKCDIDHYENAFPAILPNWDHTPRTGKKGIVLYGSTPEKFGQFVRRKMELIKDKPYQKRFLLVKSWNEWAEGNYLEPDQKYGKQFLEALKKEIY